MTCFVKLKRDLYCFCVYDTTLSQNLKGAFRQSWFMARKLAIAALLLAALVALTSCSLITGGSVFDPNDTCLSLEGAARDNCYSESKQCSKIKNTQARDSCVAELAKQKDDVKVCDLIVTGRTMGFCQFQIAVQQDNFDLCKEVVDESWQETCYYQIALQRNDADKCAYVADVDKNLDCVKKVAIATNDAELCDRLSKQNKAECLFKIATQTLNADLCAQFAEDKLNTASCYLKIAKLTDNKELCSKIPVKDIKNYCKGYFNDKAAAGN